MYKTAVAGRCLLAQAPTGIGKTMGTLFPLLKAAPAQHIDKVFFLAAKTSGRQMALDALARLSDSAPALPLRVLELVARDKACEHPDKACHGESCPLARGFYDRLPAARAAAVAPTSAGNPAPVLLQARVRDVALQHDVCPYYLSQELARWADVVVGDYNYYFDLGGLLHGLAQANQWRTALLVDEAHNLVERGRKMFTAELHPAALAQARSSPTAAQHAPVKKALDKVRRAWVALDKAHPATYTVLETFPDKLLAALQQCTTTLTEHFTDHPTEPDGALQTFYFDALHLQRMADLLDAHSMVDITQASAAHHQQSSKPGDSVVCIRNVVPAPFLQPRLAAAHTSTLFSATLQPARYYADLLGLPEDHVWVDVESPFHSGQLAVHTVGQLSTRFADRAQSLAPLAALMAGQFARLPGNYLCFASSFDYLQRIAAQLQQAHPEVPQWQQTAGMDDAARQAFLDRFQEGGQGIGFADEGNRIQLDAIYGDGIALLKTNFHQFSSGGGSFH